MPAGNQKRHVPLDRGLIGQVPRGHVRVGARAEAGSTTSPPTTAPAQRGRSSSSGRTWIAPSDHLAGTGNDLVAPPRYKQLLQHGLPAGTPAARSSASPTRTPASATRPARPPHPGRPPRAISPSTPGHIVDVEGLGPGEDQWGGVRPPREHHCNARRLRSAPRPSLESARTPSRSRTGGRRGRPGTCSSPRA